MGPCYITNVHIVTLNLTFKHSTLIELSLQTCHYCSFSFRDGATPCPPPHVCKEVMKCVRDGAFCSIWMLHGTCISSVIGAPVRSIYPNYGGMNVRGDIHRLILPRMRRLGMYTIHVCNWNKGISGQLIYVQKVIWNLV